MRLVSEAVGIPTAFRMTDPGCGTFWWRAGKASSVLGARPAALLCAVSGAPSPRLATIGVAASGRLAAFAPCAAAAAIANVDTSPADAEMAATPAIRCRESEQLRVRIG